MTEHSNYCDAPINSCLREKEIQRLQIEIQRLKKENRDMNAALQYRTEYDSNYNYTVAVIGEEKVIVKVWPNYQSNAIWVMVPPKLYRHKLTPYAIIKAMENHMEHETRDDLSDSKD